MKNTLVKPVLKWVGGKRQLLHEIIPLIPKKYSTYVEPFLGGGAVLFELQPKCAIVNDSNEELMNVYEIIKDKPEELINLLKSHEEKNSEEYYYKIRSMDRAIEYVSLTKLQRAARIIYLNKTCYNGLFRVNSAGEFNSPYGRYKNPNIVNEPTIRALSKYFQANKIEFFNEDYLFILENIKKNTFVYIDPPYMPISSSSSFTGYTKNGFSYEKQKELRDACDKLRDKGIRFVESNSDCREIRELYKEYDIKSVQAKRYVNSDAEKRGEISEVLICNV